MIAGILTLKMSSPEDKMEAMSLKTMTCRPITHQILVYISYCYSTVAFLYIVPTVIAFYVVETLTHTQYSLLAQ